MLGYRCWIRPRFLRARHGGRHERKQFGLIPRRAPYLIEVQEFRRYCLIVDLRSEQEYADDHIPGAADLPAHVSEMSVEPTAGPSGVLADMLQRAPPGGQALLCCAKD